MGCDVYANSDEIACKAGDGKVIAAFPDVCLSPPSPPAGPVPIPYPNTSFSKDMKNGSKTVKINKKEVMLKDQSFYKTSPLGDEAATKTLGAGVIYSWLAEEPARSPIVADRGSRNQWIYGAGVMFLW